MSNGSSSIRSEVVVCWPMFLPVRALGGEDICAALIRKSDLKMAER